MTREFELPESAKDAKRDQNRMCILLRVPWRLGVQSPGLWGLLGKRLWAQLMAIAQMKATMMESTSSAAAVAEIEERSPPMNAPIMPTTRLLIRPPLLPFTLFASHPAISPTM